MNKQWILSLVLLLTLSVFMTGCGTSTPTAGVGGPALPTYYVNAATGLDTNAGTQAAPFKTITRALATASTGISLNIFVAPGTYNVANGEAFPLVIASSGIHLIGDIPNKGVGAASTTISGMGNYTITGGVYAGTWGTTLVIPPNVTATVSGFDIAGGWNGILVDKGIATITSNTIKNQSAGSDSLTIVNGATVTLTSNAIETTGWYSVGLHDPITSATIRNNTITSLAGSLGDAILVDNGASVDLGTAASAGNNIILGDTGSVGLFVNTATASGTVTAVGNTWHPNVQTADALGHYGAGFVVAATPYAGGNNYAKPSATGPGIQFYGSAAKAVGNHR